MTRLERIEEYKKQKESERIRIFKEKSEKIHTLIKENHNPKQIKEMTDTFIACEGYVNLASFENKYSHLYYGEDREITFITSEAGVGIGFLTDDEAFYLMEERIVAVEKGTATVYRIEEDLDYDKYYPLLTDLYEKLPQFEKRFYEYVDKEIGYEVL